MEQAEKALREKVFLMSKSKTFNRRAKTSSTKKK